MIFDQEHERKLCLSRAAAPHDISCCPMPIGPRQCGLGEKSAWGFTRVQVCLAERLLAAAAAAARVGAKMVTLRPQARIEGPEFRRGLRTLTGEAAFSATCDSMMVGAILTAFALHLGARPAQVGFLATIAFWAQLLQGPAVLLIERLRKRKLIAVVGSLTSSLAPASMAALAFASASQSARLGMVGAVALYCGAGAFAGAAWNAWTRDIVSDDIRGQWAARRTRLSIAVNVLMGLIAAALLDVTDGDRHAVSVVFASLFAVAFIGQLCSAAALSTVPEPEMPPPPPSPQRLLDLLRTPLQDPKFRPLIRFTASWQFAVNLAQPFFTVFILQQLGLGVTMAMAFTVASQLANVWALKRWGGLSDRFGSKSVLNIAAPTYIFCIAAMIGAAQIGPREWVIGYLILVHVVMGAAGAGVSLASGNIVLKLSPAGAAAPYLSTNALLSSAIGGLAPMVGGIGAEFFAARHVGLVLEWSGPQAKGELMGLHLTGWSFYFALSALCGLYSLYRLGFVQEEGALARRDMMREILLRGHARSARPPQSGGADAPDELSTDLLR